MSQFDFYSTDLDWESFLRLLLKNKENYLIPDISYSSKEIEKTQEITSHFLQDAFVRNNVYICSEFVTQRPIGLIDLSENGTVKYDVNMEEGGECININLPGFFVEQDIIHLNSGDIFCPPRFYRNEEVFSPSKELRQFYSDTVSQIKTMLVKHQIADFKVWMTEKARDLFEEGNVKLNHLGKGYVKKNGKIKIVKFFEDD